MAENSSPVLSQACEMIREHWGDIHPHTSLICGSGWGDIIDGLSPISSIPYEKIDGMGSTTVDGHKGKLWLAKPGGLDVLVFQGRRHFYEGAGWNPVVFPALLSHELGVQSLILTNASGGIRKDLLPGDFMVIKDHLNFMGDNPLMGAVAHPKVPRFPDQSKVYSPSIQKKLRVSGEAIRQNMKTGVYLALSGPAFETPAEIDAFGKLGADAVGMSTVPEAIIANALGLQIGAVSCISNLAAGLSAKALSHEDVTSTAALALPNMTRLLAHFLPSLAE